MTVDQISMKTKFIYDSFEEHEHDGLLSVMLKASEEMRRFCGRDIETEWSASLLAYREYVHLLWKLSRLPGDVYGLPEAPLPAAIFKGRTLNLDENLPTGDMQLVHKPSGKKITISCGVVK